MNGFNFYLYKRVGNGWQKDAGAYGTHCAVSSSGVCYYMTWTNAIHYGDFGSWSSLNPPPISSSEVVSDIGVGGAAPWVVVSNSNGTGSVWGYLGANSWVNMNFNGSYRPWRIAVKGNDFKTAWVIDIMGNVYKGSVFYIRNIVKGVSWTAYPIKKAYDIAAGQDYSVYIVSRESYMGAGYKIYRANDPTSTTSPNGWTWLLGLGDVNNGICGAFGTGDAGLGCYIANPSGQVFKYNGDPNPVSGGTYWSELQ